MERPNFELKAEFIKRSGTCLNAAKKIGIRPARLSLIVNKHVTPTDKQRRAIARVIGDALTKKLLKSSQVTALRVQPKH